MSLADRINRSLKASVAAEVVYTLANAALIILLTRYLLGRAEYGLLHYALSVLGIVAILGSLGLPKSTTRFLAEYVETQPEQVRHILRSTTLGVLILSGIVSVLLVATSGLLADLLGEPSLRAFLVLGAGYVVSRAGCEYLQHVFQGFNRVDLSAAMNAITGVGRLVVGVGLVLAGFGTVGVMLGYVAGFVLAIAVGGVVFYRRFYREIDGTGEAETGLVKRVFGYSVPLTATRSAGIIDNRIDTILVGALVNPTAVAYYVLAKQISDFSVVPASAFGVTISPALAEQKASEQIERAARLYEQTLGHVLLLYAPACVGLAMLAEPLVRLVFSGKYVGAAPVLQVFCAFILVNAVNKTTSDGLDYLGRARERAFAKTGMAGANFGLNLLLIPRYQAVGAAVATVVTFGAYTAVNVYYIHQELPLRVDGLVRTAAATVVLSVIVGGVVTVLLPYVSTLPTLAGVIALGGSVWVVLAVVSGAVDVEWVSAYLM